MTTFVHTPRFHQALMVFLKLSSEREDAYLPSLRKHIPTALRKLRLGKDKNRFNILSIGAGDGFMDREIVKIVEGHLNVENQLEDVEIFNTAVEPTDSYMKQYKEYFESQDDVSTRKKSVKFEFKPLTFESYICTEHVQNRYDLIQALNSLYFVDCLESTLSHCYHHELKNKGLIVCILLGQGCVFNRIKKVLNRKDYFFTSDDVISVVQKNQWDFVRFSCPLEYDVTGILKEKSEEGKLLLDFLTFEADFFNTKDKETVGHVCKLLDDLSYEDQDGRLIVKEVYDLLIIHKT